MRFRPPVLCLLSSALSFMGCAKRETPADAGIRTQTLLLGNGAEPADLDPQILTAYSDQNIMMALFEGLTALDEQTSQPAPTAAERWDISADGLTWTFQLRPGLKWSNGEPLTADDFVASWRRLLSPALGAENAYYLYPIQNAEAFNKGTVTEPGALGVAAPDTRTLVVTLARPTPYFAMLTAQPATYPVNVRVLAKFDALTKRGTAWTRPGNLAGNGPFLLKEWLPNARIAVARNPHHRDAANVGLREIVFFPTENPDVDERNFRARQVHATFTLPLTKVSAWRERASRGEAAAMAELRLDPFLQTVFLRFNTQRRPLDDARVRRALSLAIPREAIARTVLRGSRAPAFTLTPPGTGGYTAQAQTGTNFDAARGLLTAAGHANGAGLPAFEVQCRNDEIQPQVAEVLQATWQRELGLRITITQTEQKTWLQNQQSLAYMISFGSWIGDFPDPANFLGLFVTGGGYNWTGWGNRDFDLLLTAADGTANNVQRHESLQKAEALLLDAAPIAPLFHGAQTYLLHPAVKGWPPALLGTRRYQAVRLGE
ncbi:MAG: peptide ABC transporter substrate-binding protein [Verrucomicrobia bacterium]|nr:peptide ABC transporter substrate-binding protein [Verrucomicrobiota bacterium]